MIVVRVRHVDVVMLDRFVLVLVRVFTPHGWIVDVGVVRVVVTVGVLVPYRAMAMRMRMPFGQMEAETEKHREESDAGRPSAKWLAQGNGDGGGDERCGREERCGAGRPDAALREEIQAQAQTVTGGSAREQGEDRC